MSLHAGADAQKVARGVWPALLAAAAQIGWRAGGGEAAILGAGCRANRPMRLIEA